MNERQARVLLITGPGHGAAANLANHYLDGSLEEFYPDMTRDAAGVERFVRAFSWPGGFPSHLTPGTPGTIHEGGELGYALATAFGAAMDNPDLFVACIVGDGEAETGPTAGSWNSNRFLDPRTGGAVLPILDVNGYKISSATIAGTMSDDELLTLYRGYGWTPLLVSGDDDGVDARMAGVLDEAWELIGRIQGQARSSGATELKPAWPMIVLRTPKGWTGPKEIDGKKIEGSFRAHQVPAGDLKTNPAHLAIVESWLRSYKPEELFEIDGSPAPDIQEFVPRGDLRLGMVDDAIGGRVRRPMDLPDASIVALPVDQPGATDAGALDQVGAYLREVMERTEEDRNFRIFCPDELESNKLGAVLEVTGRAHLWSGEADSRFAPDGRVVEVLAEHLCEGYLEGYLKTGRHGLFPCYEAFIQIVDSQIAQYAKWLKVSAEIPWRLPLGSLNILLTSDAWRQDHNGFSHQNPGFINSLLTKKGTVLRITLPPDGNTLSETVARCLRSTGYINLVIATKQPLPQWLSMDEAKAHADAGASIWRWASTDEGLDPDVVMAAAGMVPTNEILAAVDLLATDVPDLRVRVVNVMDLMRLESRRSHPHALEAEPFSALFTADKPVDLQLPRLPVGDPPAHFGAAEPDSLPRPRLCRRGHHHDPLRHARSQRDEPLPAGNRGDPAQRPLGDARGRPRRGPLPVADRGAPPVHCRARPRFGGHHVLALAPRLTARFAARCASSS